MTQPTTLAHLQVDSPLGRLLLIATDHGLVRLAFSTEGFARVLDTVTESLQPDVVQPLPNTATTAGHLIEQAASELDDYFAGALTAFTVPVDFALSRGFHREVREHLASIPYASTVSYSTIAEHLGRPQAVRAVGTGCSGNPVPIVVPCHRVLRADGSLGGYRAGAAAKAILLDLERRSAAQAA